MNPEQNNLNQNNLNTQSNNNLQNNQPLNNNIYQNQNIQQSTPQPMNYTFNNENTNSQNFNTKPPKKRKLGVMIGIIVIVVIITMVSLFFIKLNTNDSSDTNNAINQNNDSIQIGNVKIDVLSDENEINNAGLYKVGNEYIFKGGDSYTEKLENGNYHKTYKLGNLKNFVKFNNNYWRMIKINADGTIKLVWAGKYIVGDEVLNDIDLDVKYIETKTNNFNYENSDIRNYLNTTLLNDTSIIPSNYEAYLVQSAWDISTYEDSIYDMYSYENSENLVTKQTSSFKDYIGILSIEDFYNAKMDSQLPPSGEYKNNFIENILESTGGSTALAINTSNMIVDENNNTLGVAQIARSNGNWFMLTNTNADNNTNNVLPVITLKSNINFESGDGTVENPYIIK